MIEVHAHPVDKKRYHKLAVFVDHGANEVWKDPEISVFNKAIEGTYRLEKPAGSYKIFVKSLNMEYKVKVLKQ